MEAHRERLAGPRPAAAAPPGRGKPSTAAPLADRGGMLLPMLNALLSSRELCSGFGRECASTQRKRGGVCMMSVLILAALVGKKLQSAQAAPVKKAVPGIV